jgi:hypothetical protein
MCGVLVGGKAGAVGRKLKEHTAGLAKIHGLEPEAIDHRRRPAASFFDLQADGMLMRLIVHSPCEVMHGADAPRAPGDVTGFAYVNHAPPVFESIAGPPVFRAESLEAEHRG